MTEIWCEHMKSIKELMNGLVLKDDKYWNYCPVCGAKRPEKDKKLLWEKIVELGRGPSLPDEPDGLQYFRLYAKTAIEAVKEVVDEVYSQFRASHTVETMDNKPFAYSFTELKRKLDEML